MIILSIFIYLLKRKSKDIFDPVFLFSLFYITTAFSIFYLCSGWSENNQFLNTTFFYSSNMPLLINEAAFYSFIGYLCFIFGYEVQNNSKYTFSMIKIEKQNKISSSLALYLIVAFVILAAVNLIYNIYSFANGDLLFYMKNVALRIHEFSIRGTTIGYNFAYSATFLLQFLYLRKNKKSTLVFFWIVLFFSILLKASTGRVTQTIIFPLTFAVVFYYHKASMLKKINNSSYIKLIVFLSISAIIFYFLRVGSSLVASGQSLNVETFRMFFMNFNYYAFDMGNTPNIPVLVKIIDSWGNDIGYLMGKSLFYWIFSALPSHVKDTFQPVSIIVKNQWYPHIQGGSLPPTAVGEMYANFGLIGPFIGMFFIGLIFGLFYRFIKKRGRLVGYIIYANLLLGFIVIFPKTETHNLSLLPVIIYLFPFMFLAFLTNLITAAQNKAKSEIAP